MDRAIESSKEERGSSKVLGIRVIRGRSVSRVEESWSVAGEVPAHSNRLSKEVADSRTIRKLEAAKGQVSFLTAIAQYQPIRREAYALIVIGVF